VEPIHDELRAQAEIEEEKYRQEKEAYKRQKRGDGIPEPTPPPIRLLFLPANSSSTAIYQALNENGEQGLMFETEGDTLASTFGQDFGDFSDGLRKAFHHESITYILGRVPASYLKRMQCIKKWTNLDECYFFHTFEARF
jgi:hypothetical protein